MSDVNASPPGMLTPEEYQLLAAPALQTAAQVAAFRGDPHLYNDMPSMLALLGMVTALIHAYLQQPPPAGASHREILETAPLAVCALAFSESGLSGHQVQDCIRALSAAYLQLLRAGVFGPQDAFVDKAFQQLMAGQKPAALQNLRQGALAMAKAVDRWEAGRVGG